MIFSSIRAIQNHFSNRKQKIVFFLAEFHLFFIFAQNFFMIDITLPDGSVRNVEVNSTSMDIALSISEGLARNVLAAVVNGEVVDANRPIKENASLQLLTWRDNEGQSTMWHSFRAFNG